MDKKNRYKASSPEIILDGFPSNNYTNDDFELQHYENHTFDDQELYLHNYTDFTGSREVGIDVGPFEGDVNFIQPANQLTSYNKLNLKTLPITTSSIKEEDEKIMSQEPTNNISNLLALVNEALVSSSHDKVDQFTNPNKVEENNFFNTNQDDPFFSFNLQTEQIQIETVHESNKEMSREDFDDLFNRRFSEILDEQNLQSLFPPKDLESVNKAVVKNESESEIEFDDDAESEITSIFNKDNIEKNLPELFGIKEEDSDEFNTTKDFDEKIEKLNSENHTKQGKHPIEDFVRRSSAPLGFFTNNNQLNLSDISSAETEPDNHLNNSIKLFEIDVEKSVKNGNPLAKELTKHQDELDQDNDSLEDDVETEEDEYDEEDEQLRKETPLTNSDDFTIGNELIDNKDLR